MEVENRKPKKKHIEDEEEEKENEKLKKKLKAEQKEEDGGGSGVPTEEEVEEFYAILRRMKVAVKYFDDKCKGRREWREALEQAELTVVDGEDHGGDCGGVADDKKKEGLGGGVMINEGFDLNAVAPEAAESGGA